MTANVPAIILGILYSQYDSRYVGCHWLKNTITGSWPKMISLIHVNSLGNVELNWPKLLQAFSVKLTIIFYHECVRSIILHQHMYKLCILSQNVDF